MSIVTPRAQLEEHEEGASEDAVADPLAPLPSARGPPAARRELYSAD